MQMQRLLRQRYAAECWGGQHYKHPARHRVHLRPSVEIPPHMPWWRIQFARCRRVKHICELCLPCTTQQRVPPPSQPARLVDYSKDRRPRITQGSGPVAVIPTQGSGHMARSKALRRRRGQACLYAPRRTRQGGTRQAAGTGSMGGTRATLPCLHSGPAQRSLTRVTARAARPGCAGAGSGQPCGGCPPRETPRPGSRCHAPPCRTRTSAARSRCECALG